MAIKFTDQEYLEYAIMFCQQQQFSHFCAMVDLNKCYLYANEAHLNMLNIAGAYQGKQLKDLNVPFGKYGEFWQDLHEQFKNSNEQTMVLTMVYELNHKIQVFEVILNKLINPTTNNILAFLHYANQVCTQSVVAKILANTKHNIINKADLSIYHHLNDMDLELLLLLAIGKTHKEIAQILNILYRKEVSVESVTMRINRNLYSKFKVNSSSELIEIAYAHGLLDRLPLSFLPLLKQKLLI